MRKFTILLLAVCFLSFFSNDSLAQKSGDQLTVKTGIFKNKYYKGVWNISQEKALGILSENGECYALANKGLKLQRTFRVMAGAGTAMVAFSAISAAADADPRWYIAGIGGGIILVSIPIYSSGHKRLNEAIEVYNEEELSAYRPKQFIKDIKLVGTDTGVGIRMSF